MSKLVAAVAAALALLSANAVAHHFFAATYVEGQRLTLDGRVARWMYVNPHAMLHVVTTDRTEGTIEWIVEWDSALYLGRHGITDRTLAPGQRVIVSGSPGRKPEEHRVRLRTIVRPSDGWKWPRKP